MTSPPSFRRSRTRTAVLPALRLPLLLATAACSLRRTTRSHHHRRQLACRRLHRWLWLSCSIYLYCRSLHRSVSASLSSKHASSFLSAAHLRVVLIPCG